jgi:hypothetical protein
MNNHPLDRNRLQALSRARGTANDSSHLTTQEFCLLGINAGDVLDWSDAGMFLAVAGVTQKGLYALGVSQQDPWATMRDIRMAAVALYVCLNHGWTSKVPSLRRK